MKKLKWNFIIITLLSAISFSACNDNHHAQNAKDETARALEQEKNQLKEDIHKAQRDIDTRLVQLKIDLKEASADAKVEIQHDIDKLEVKKRELADDLERFGDKAAAEWAQFKANVKMTIDEIGNDDERR